MTTKLTLTVEQAVIERAKTYARKTGRSLSAIIESYLESLIQQEPDPEDGMNDDLKKLFGSARIPANLDHKEEFRKIMQKKYGK